MKNVEIAKCEAQIVKLRECLGDHRSPATKIKKPVGMRTIIFEQKIGRLREKEAQFRALLSEGCRKWSKR